MTIYPSRKLFDSYQTSRPRTQTIVVVAIICACLLLFALQDYLVRTRSVGLMRMFTATSKILDDVFPRAVRARVLQVQQTLIKKDVEQGAASAEHTRGAAQSKSAGALQVIQRWVVRSAPRASPEHFDRFDARVLFTTRGSSSSRATRRGSARRRCSPRSTPPWRTPSKR